MKEVVIGFLLGHKFLVVLADHVCIPEMVICIGNETVFVQILPSY